MSKHHLIPFMSFFSQQTTVQLLRQADIVIFMHHDHYEYATKILHFQQTPYQIWDIPDLYDHAAINTEAWTDRLLIDVTERTFDMIKEKAETFLETLPCRMTEDGQRNEYHQAF